MTHRESKRVVPRPSMLACLPAIAALVAVALGCLVVAVAHPSRAALIERYQQVGDRATLAGDGQTARICATRLMQLDPGDPSNRQRLAFANALGR